MTTRRNLRWLILPILIFSLQTSRADAPFGMEEYVIDSSIPVVDLTGGYQIPAVVRHPDGTPAELVFTVQINQNSRGKLSGRDLTVVTLGNDFFAGRYRVSGEVTRSGGVTRAKITVRITGESAIIAGRTIDHFEITSTIRGEVDPDSGELIGQIKTSGKFENLGKAKGRDRDFTIELSDAVNGTWTLTLDVVPGIRPLAGEATITLPNGRVLDFKLSGDYSSRRDRSKLELRGRRDSTGSHLGVTLDGFLDITRLKGKVLGQRVNY